jgi:hypothetical protein
MHRRELFRALIDYAETSGCRHDSILRYFEDEAETLGGCGHCDTCRARTAGTAGVEPDAEASAPTIRTSIEAIRGLPFSVGPGTLAAYLLGNQNAQIKRYFWHQRPQFGLLKERNEDWIKRMLRRMVAAGLLAVDPEHGTLKITRRAADVEMGTRPNTVALPPDAAQGALCRSRPARSGQKPAPPTEGQLDAHAIALYAKLRDWRIAVAQKQDVPPYVIADDAALRSIAHLQPANTEALLTAYGIGPGRAEKYGMEILAIVRGHVVAEGARPAEAIAAVTEAAADAPRSYNEERKAEARKLYPRAYEPWTDEEDERLRVCINAGQSLDEVVAVLQRQPGAIKIRAGRFDLGDLLWSAEEDEHLRARLAAGDDAEAIAIDLQHSADAIRMRAGRVTAEAAVAG